MKKYVLAGAIAISALFSVATQAAPLTGPATIEVAQGNAVQKVFYRGGRRFGHYGWGRHGYGHWGHRRGYGWGWGYGSWCYWHPYRCGYRW